MAVRRKISLPYVWLIQRQAFRTSVLLCTVRVKCRPNRKLGSRLFLAIVKRNLSNKWRALSRRNA